MLAVGPEVCCACVRMSEGFKLVPSALLPCPGRCNSPLALPLSGQGDRAAVLQSIFTHHVPLLMGGALGKEQPDKA